MRSSLIILLCLVIVMVNAASTTTTRRRRVANATRPSTTKAPVPKSVYAYLRSVRGKNSCAQGSCPFWERHGRSFAALRCYAQQYRECTCLHRMCFSSCMFTRQVCNQEMVACLRQICPRCMPASASAMCAVYDSMAERVAEALSVFACYPCCPIINSGTNNNTNINSIIITTNTVPAASTALPFNGFNGQMVTDPSGLNNFDDGENFGNEDPSGTGEEINSGMNSNINYFPGNNGNNGVSNTGNAASNGNFNNFPGNNGGSNGNSNGFPANNGGSNGNFNNFPGNNGGLNGNFNNFPVNNGGLNGNFNNFPSNNGGLNGNFNSFPVNNGGSNGNLNGFPANNGGLNGNFNGFPANNDVSNGNLNTFPSNNGASNGNLNSLPSNNGASNGNLNSLLTNNGAANGIVNSNSNSNGNSNSNANSNAASTGNGNHATNCIGNAVVGICDTISSYPGAVFPGTDLFFNNNLPSRNQQTVKQRVRQTLRTTKRQPTATRRTPATKRPSNQANATVRANKVNSGVRKPVQTQKKPQTNNLIKS